MKNVDKMKKYKILTLLVIILEFCLISRSKVVSTYINHLFMHLIELRILKFKTNMSNNDVY